MFFLSRWHQLPFLIYRGRSENSIYIDKQDTKHKKINLQSVLVKLENIISSELQLSRKINGSV